MAEGLATCDYEENFFVFLIYTSSLKKSTAKFADNSRQILINLQKNISLSQTEYSY